MLPRAVGSHCEGPHDDGGSASMVTHSVGAALPPQPAACSPPRHSEHLQVLVAVSVDFMAALGHFRQHLRPEGVVVQHPSRSQLWRGWSLKASSCSTRVRAALRHLVNAAGTLWESW